MADLTAILNADIIFADKILHNTNVVVNDGKIDKIGFIPDKSFSGNIIDGSGLYLSPGFIDIHCHGGGGHDFMDASEEAFLGACETHAKFGTTSILPTTLAGDENEMIKTFDAFESAKSHNRLGATMLGLHLEGPYFSKEFKGAQDEKYIVNPSPEQFKRLYERSNGNIIRWSAAPELDGIDEFADFLSASGIIASIAHTSAEYDDVVRAYDKGFRLITHLYSGMSTIVRRGGYRVPGVLESAYIIDDMKCELIADGCHLPPPLLLLAYKCKGAKNLVLVTDSMRGAGMPEGESILGSLEKGQKVFIENGVAFMPDKTAFAGSVCTTDRLVRTMTKSVGISLIDAVRMITLSPAEILGITDKKGVIAPGADADLLLFDDNINIKLTMINGRIVHGGH